MVGRGSKVFNTIRNYMLVHDDQYFDPDILSDKLGIGAPDIVEVVEILENDGEIRCPCQGKNRGKYKFILKTVCANQICEKLILAALSDGALHYFSGHDDQISGLAAYFITPVGEMEQVIKNMESRGVVKFNKNTGKVVINKNL